MIPARSTHSDRDFPFASDGGDADQSRSNQSEGAGFKGYGGWTRTFDEGARVIEAVGKAGPNPSLVTATHADSLPGVEVESIGL